VEEPESETAAVGAGAEPESADARRCTPADTGDDGADEDEVEAGLPAATVEPCAVARVGAAGVDVFVVIAGAAEVDEPCAGAGVPADAVEPCASAGVGAAEVDVFVVIAGAAGVDEPRARAEVPAEGDDPAATVSTCGVERAVSSTSGALLIALGRTVSVGAGTDGLTVEPFAVASMPDDACEP
jgi:hypothetical protein